MKKHIFCIMLVVVSMLCFACGGQNSGTGSNPSEQPFGGAVLFGYKLEVLDEDGNNVLRNTKTYQVMTSDAMKPQKEYSVFVGSFVGSLEIVKNGGEMEFEPYKNVRFEYDDRYMTIEADTTKGDGYYVLTTNDITGKTLLCVHTNGSFWNDVDCIIKISPNEEE